jgi:hypothetical protein
MPMFKSIYEKYTDIVKKQTHYYPLLPPDKSVSLGDFGVVEDGEFIREGNMFDDFGFEVKGLKGKGLQTFDFKEEANFDASVNPSVKFPGNVDASIQIVFISDSSVFFSFNVCKSSEVKNYLALEEKVLELYNENKWNKNYFVITGLFEADKSTIILAEGNNAKITLEANAPIEATIPMAQIKSDFLNGKITCSESSSTNISTKIIAENNLTPLIKLSKLTEHFFENDTLDPKFLVMPGRSPIGKPSNENLVKNIKTIEDVKDVKDVTFEEVKLDEI